MTDNKIDYASIVASRKPRRPDRIKLIDPHQERQARLRIEKLRWPIAPVCPYCGFFDSWVMKNREGYYKCKSCRSQYTVRVGTIMHGTHLSYIDWLKVIEQFSISEKGYPARQITRYIECTNKTAWYLGHRLRCAMLKDRHTQKLKGVVEIDEIYLGNRSKKSKFDKEDKIRRVRRPFVFDMLLKILAVHYVANPDILVEIVCAVFLIIKHFELTAQEKKEKEEKRRKRKGKTRGRGTSKRAVLVMVERGGQSLAIPMNRLNKAHLTAELLAHVSFDATIITDGYKGYCEVEKTFAEHKKVNHSQGLFDKGKEHINFVESFNSLLRRGYFGIYHQYTDRHLHRYCVEMSYKRRNRFYQKDERIENTLKHFEGKRMFYKRKSTPDILLSVYAFKRVWVKG